MQNKVTMTTSNKDDAAAAAERIGSMSLGKSVEEKDNETEKTEAEENGTTPTKFCSACDKEGSALKKCTACKCVWYCDKECQNKHWKEHRKECKLIKKELDKRGGGKIDLGTELGIGPLGKVPPREECPICMRALPLHDRLHTYFDCCGKVICGGCQMKSGERADTCAFCRTTMPESGADAQES